MKKIIVAVRLVLAAAVAMSFVPSSLADVKWTYDSGASTLTEIVSSGTAWIMQLTSAGVLTTKTGGSSTALDFSDGAMPDGAPSIVSLGSSAFKDVTTIESVLLPATTTAFSDYAFLRCTALVSVSAPGLRTIGTRVFDSCSSLVFDLPSTLESIGSQAFVNCSYGCVTSIPPSVVSIEASAFGTYPSLSGGGLTIAFGGDLPTMSSLVFQTGPSVAPSRYYYYLRLLVDPTDHPGWQAYISDTSKVRPWSDLADAEKSQFWAFHPGAPVPYGLTLSESDGIPIGVWIAHNWRNGNYPYDDGFIATYDDAVATNWVDGKIIYLFTNTLSKASGVLRQDMTLEELLAVAGGGGGGTAIGGGGGGGGVAYSTSTMVLSAGAGFSIEIGAGGGPGANGGSTILVIGGRSYELYGGGAGGTYDSGAPAHGQIGSGGGAGGGLSADKVDGVDYTVGQGHPGGDSVSSSRATGGGGGYSEEGGSGSGNQSGNGGEGLEVTIGGVAGVFGSGGGGGAGIRDNKASLPGTGGTNAGDGASGNVDPPTDATSAVPTFGGGGGGGGANKTLRYAAGSGASGRVMLVFSPGAESGQPEVTADDIAISFPDGVTQPFVSITLGGEGSYSANVTISCGTGVLAQAGTEYECTRVFPAVANGDTLQFLCDFYPSTGETVYVKVIVTADGATDVVASKEAVAIGVVPDFVGHGGNPATVIHVRDGATGKATGENWADAYTDLREAIALLDGTRNEVWYCGSNVTMSAAAIALTATAAIRGGFDGTEDSTGDRTAGAVSTIDGHDVYDALDISSSSALTIDGFRFWRGLRHGLDKTGAGDFFVTNCVFEASGTTVDQVDGRGLRVVGDSSSTQVQIVDCVVSGNVLGSSSLLHFGRGAVSLASLAAASVEGCHFEGNGGSSMGIAPASGAPGRLSGYGMALNANGVAVTVRNCRFVCNVSTMSGYAHASGGVLYLEGACGGSEVRNCLFLGNEILNGSGTVYSDTDAATVMINASDDSQTVTVANCTFAHNRYCGDSSTAALSVLAGMVVVKDSIFHGNVATNYVARWPNGSPVEDIRAFNNASVTVGYTLFDKGGTCRAEDSASITLSNCLYGDPLFVGDDSALDGCVTSAGYYQSSATSVLESFDVHISSESPALDAGDPRSSYANEAKPNGLRVNLGFYGNTPYATLSPPTGFMVILR